MKYIITLSVAALVGPQVCFHFYVRFKDDVNSDQNILYYSAYFTFTFMQTFLSHFVKSGCLNLNLQERLEHSLEFLFLFL